MFAAIKLMCALVGFSVGFELLTYTFQELTSNLFDHLGGGGTP